MSADKEKFLKNTLVTLLGQIPTETHPVWGRMTLQQMIEHFSESVKIASGRNLISHIITPEERIPKFQEFLMSEKPFKENTKNPLLPEVPAPVKNKSVNDALLELKDELDHFFSVFDANEHLLTTHSIFGELNFQMNVQLLYKHAIHHLRQFGVEVGGSLAVTAN